LQELQTCTKQRQQQHGQQQNLHQDHPNLKAPPDLRAPGNAKCAAVADETRFGTNDMHNYVGGAFIIPTRMFSVGPAVTEAGYNWFSVVATICAFPFQSVMKSEGGNYSEMNTIFPEFVFNLGAEDYVFYSASSSRLKYIYIVFYLPLLNFCILMAKRTSILRPYIPPQPISLHCRW
jgi:hypothetical protein